MGSAVATAVEHEKLVVSLSVNSNYVKPSVPGEIKADCTIIRLGKTITVTRAEIRNAQSLSIGNLHGKLKWADCRELHRAI